VVSDGDLSSKAGRCNIRENVGKWEFNASNQMVKYSLPFFFAAASLFAQTNTLPNAASSTNENLAVLQHVEELRAQCIQNRRMICGKIIKIMPEGIVVDSGYTNLMRAPLNQSWLIPASVAAERATNVVEATAPDAICFGKVFVIDVPKPPRGTQPKLFDYVVLEGFPMGHYTYASVGTVQHTVRQFSTKVTTAVRWRYGQEVDEKPKASAEH
jgi:hypothetical protein